MGPSSTDLETYLGDWHAARLHVSFKNCVYDPTQKILSVFWQTFLQYGVLTVGNLLLYFGVMQLIFFNLPIWIISILLAGVSIGIYLIRTKVKII